MGADEERCLARLGYSVAILTSLGKFESLANKLVSVGGTGLNPSEEDLRRLVDAASITGQNIFVDGVITRRV